ncbi:Os07g0456600 [Oryza sativa Japonica Group]|uniref:Os07g0456600 protein n=1 Tax=Oryza sativa subsp. japonica TaxID=39947 RepID=A0A0P0X5K1_ORYSJ|nr:Os07g0456600 [Oryza sativa Japonica Group]
MQKEGDPRSFPAARKQWRGWWWFCPAIRSMRRAPAMARELASKPADAGAAERTGSGYEAAGEGQPARQACT